MSNAKRNDDDLFVFLISKTASKFRNGKISTLAGLEPAISGVGNRRLIH